VKIHLDKKDWWTGLYVGDSHLYFCIFTLVLRINR
jgi:hypothetical protein